LNYRYNTGQMDQVKIYPVLKDTGFNIDQAYIYGSCARGENSDNSAIDVMLVSD
jgi:predicted nucleotidyltransferase